MALNMTVHVLLERIERLVRIGREFRKGLKGQDVLQGLLASVILLSHVFRHGGRIDDLLLISLFFHGRAHWHAIIYDV